MRTHEISSFVTETLLADPDLDASSVANLGKELHYYTEEDINSLDSLNYPYCHTFCYSKTHNVHNELFIVAMAVSALRITSETTDRKTENKTMNNIGIVTDKALSILKDELKAFGINGVKGFEIDTTSENVSPLLGEDDVQYVIEFHLNYKKC